MFKRWHDERVLQSILDGCEDGSVRCADGVYRRRYGSVMRDVVRGLRAEGMSAGEILMLIAAILTAIQELGDVVRLIIDRVRGRS
jgi:hypothetical protein